MGVRLTAVWILGLLAPATAVPSPQVPGLEWLPDEAVLVMGLRDATGPADRALVDVLAFAFEVGDPIDALSSAAGVESWADLEWAVAAVVPAPDLEVLVVAKASAPSRPSGPALEGAQSSGVAVRVEGDLVIAGHAPLVTTAAARREGTRPALIERAARSGSEGRVWAVASREWLAFDFERQAVVEASVEGRSLSAALQRIEAVEYAAETEGATGFFGMTAYAADAEDAALLADGLWELFAEQSPGDEGLTAMLEGVAIDRQDDRVSLRLPAPAAAVATLRESTTVRGILRWRLGGRERRQRIAATIDALSIGPGSRVADVGAGSGFFSVRLARAVGPAGRVYAVEIRESLIEKLKERRSVGGFDNLEPVLGAVDDPRLPAGSLDAVLIVNAYHEMTEAEAMLTRIRYALRPGGRLVLVEPFQPGSRARPRADQVGEHQLAPELIADELEAAGFELVRWVDEFIGAGDEGPGRDSLVVARRPRH